MADRAKTDEDYKSLIEKIVTGIDFKKLPDGDPHKC